MQFTMIHAILAGLTLVSLLLLLWQWLAGFQFPLHRRELGTRFSPPISLLKPLKGCDSETKACLLSWFAQDYRGTVQILLGVASSADPVCVIVRELMAEFPGIDAELVYCQEQFGPNAKVSTLIHLERLAKYDLLLVSDADVRAPADLLANAVQPLADSKVGLVNCFYKFANPSTYPMHWEAFAANADFWNQVLQSEMIKPIDFALGAAMLLRRDDLAQVGGFEKLVNFLADDYQLGNRIAKTGKRLVISPVVVECWEAPKTFSEVWRHQLRWARTIRVCQPVPYFFSILSNASIWPIFWSGYLALKMTSIQVVFLPILIFLPIRMWVALNSTEKLTGTFTHYRYYWMVPVKDVLSFCIWALSFTGSTVEWRGEKFEVIRGGEMQRINGSVEAEKALPLLR